MKYTTDVDENGEFNTPTGLIPGRYNTTIKYTDNVNNKYSDSEWTGKLHIRYPVTLICDDLTVDAYSTTTIQAQLLNHENEPLTNTPITIQCLTTKIREALFEMKGVYSIIQTTDDKGYISFTYNAELSGSDDITLSYDGSLYYIPIQKTITITTAKATPALTVTSTTAWYVNQEGLLQIKLHVGNHLLQNKAIVFNINNNTYTTYTDDNGIAQTTIQLDTAGTYDCVVSYTPSTTQVNGRRDSWDYNSVTKTIPITIKPKINPNITATVTSPINYNNTSIFVLTYKHPSTGNAVSGVGVTIQIPEESFSTYLITNSNGQISLNHTMITNGTTNIVFITNETTGFNSVRVSRVVQVNPIETKLTGTAQTITYSNEASITCTLTDNNDTAISGKKITLYDNDDDYVGSGTTNSSGQCTIKCTPVTVGTLEYKLQFEGDTQYASKTSTVNITVNKINTKFNGSTTISLNAGEETPVSLTLVTSDGKTLPNKTITITDNNKTSTTTADDNGIFSFNTSGTLNEQRSATVEYKGDTYYNTCTSTITLNFGKYVPVINTDIRENSIGSPCVFYVKVTSDNNITPTGSVTYTGESQKNTVTLSAGDWNICNKYTPTESGYNDITVTYNGDDNFISVTKEISVYTTPGIVEDCSSLDNFYVRTIKYQTYYPNPSQQPRVDTEGVHGYYGRALWAKNLKVTDNCTVTMEIKVKNVAHGFNFGLVTKGNMSHTAVLLEQSTSKSYFYFATDTSGKYRIPNINWNRLSLDTWYTVEFIIKNGKCTINVNNYTYTRDIIIDDNTYPAIFVWSPRLSGESSSSEVICRKIVLIKG